MIRRFSTMIAALRRLRDDRSGLGAVEFAFVAPFMLLLYVGSFQLMDAISAYRKVTITARSLADLATQNDTDTPTSMSDILDAARQVMTPYPTASASLVIVQIGFDANANPSIIWVCNNSSTPKCAQSDPGIKLSDIKIPADLKVANGFTVFSQIVFHYTPKVAGSLIGPLTFSDHIFMNPRQSPSICLNTGTTTNRDCMGQPK